MNGTIKIGGEEIIISDNKPGDYILAGFSGYMGLVSGIDGKKIGLILDVKNGIISAVFDQNMNNKELLSFPSSSLGMHIKTK